MREKATDLFADRKLDHVIYFDGISRQFREHRNGVSYAAGIYGMGNTMTEPLFDLGRVVITANAQQTLQQRGQYHMVETMLGRHALGDWGDLDPEDLQANNEALRDGSRLLSAYCFDDYFKVWIITEADRSATTILLPEDY